MMAGLKMVVRWDIPGAEINEILVISATWVQGEKWQMGVAYEQVNRVEVADRIGSTVFILQGVERRDYGHIQGQIRLPNQSRLETQLTIGRVQNANFVPDTDTLDHRLSLQYSAPMTRLKQRSRRQ